MPRRQGTSIKRFFFCDFVFLFLFFACEPQADKADGPEDKTFTSPLQATMFCGKMEGRFRLFIARTKASNRCVDMSAASRQARTGEGFPMWISPYDL